MASILIITVGVTGRVNAGIEMARRLRARGHDVSFASLDERAGAPLEAQGIAFHPLESGMTATLRARIAGTHSSRKSRALQADIARARGAAAIAGHGIDAVLAIAAPDLVLVESELHATILSLLGRGVPLALLEYHIATRRQPGIAPLDSALRPDDALAGLRAAAAWRWLHTKRSARHCYERWRKRGWDARSVWARIAAASGHPLNALASEKQWPLLHYPRLPCIHLSAAELDFPGAADEARAGPVIAAQRADPPGDEDAPACRVLLEQLRGTGRPLVACATGSILSLPDFSRRIVTAADGAPFDMLLATGRGSDPANLGELPANVHAFRYIPQVDVLRDASLFVCHGGIASIHESLLAGVPMLVCSGGCLDENGNAARVEFHGLGRRADMSDQPAVLRARIEALLGDNEVNSAVNRMRTTLLRYADEQRFENLVDELLTRAPTLAPL